MKQNGFPLLILKFQFNSVVSLKAAHCKRVIFYMLRTDLKII